MKLVTIKVAGSEKVAVLTRKGVILVDSIHGLDLKNYSFTDILTQGKLKMIEEWIRHIDEKLLEPISLEKIEYAPLYRHPRKIWGIGMNYKSVKVELGAIEESDPVFL